MQNVFDFVPNQIFSFLINFNGAELQVQIEYQTKDHKLPKNNSMPE